MAAKKKAAKRTSKKASKKKPAKKPAKKAAKKAPKKKPAKRTSSKAKKKPAKSAAKKPAKKAARKHRAQRITGPAVPRKGSDPVLSSLPPMRMSDAIGSGFVSPAASAPRKRLHRAGKPLLAVGLGALALLGLAAAAKGSPSAATPAPSPSPNPKPSPPPPASPAVSPATPATPVTPPPAPGTPVEDWRVSADGLVTLNSLSGYHRAKKKEVSSAAAARSTSFLKFDIRTVHFETIGNRDYAFAVEEHNNHPEIGSKNKGISIFVRD